VIDVDASLMPSFLRGSASTADVDAALSWASGAVEAYCERNFSYAAGDVVLVDPFPAKRSAQLPNPPVLSVSTVEGFMRNETGSMSWQPLVNYAWTKDGLLYDTTGQPGTQISEVPSWPSAPKSLRVTYTHGYLDIPQPVKDAVIKAASGYLANPFANTSRKVGDVESAWSVTLLQQSMIDETILAPYRLITIAR
jgi:hypothetical protein